MEKTNRSKYDYELLVARLARMRIEGSSTLTVIRFLQDELGYKQKPAYEVLKSVHQWVKEHMIESNREVWEDTIARLENLYETGDNKIKMDVIKELNKLRGLYATQKIDLTSGGEKLGEIKLIEIRKNENT